MNFNQFISKTLLKFVLDEKYKNITLKTLILKTKKIYSKKKYLLIETFFIQF